MAACRPPGSMFRESSLTGPVTRTVASGTWCRRPDRTSASSARLISSTAGSQGADNRGHRDRSPGGQTEPHYTHMLASAWRLDPFGRLASASSMAPPRLGTREEREQLDEDEVKRLLSPVAERFSTVRKLGKWVDEIMALILVQSLLDE